MRQYVYGIIVKVKTETGHFYRRIGNMYDTKEIALARSKTILLLEDEEFIEVKEYILTLNTN